MFNDDDDERSARKSSLKGLLKAFKGKGELRALVQELQALRVQLQLRQPMLKQAVYELPGRNIPLILCSNPARSGISYLRWRNLDNNRSGSVALQEAIQRPDVSDELRDALMTLEWRRQVLNTQLSLVMFMLRRIQLLTTLV
ncbi:DUF3158 family protein [Enterobacter hormaechei]|uniref:DUF3158 family protein n=1 Tax=Enterobacter hormaechei TaxID=158836 RepID=UPI0006653420|nr:DUF3158 family protein [Enterobacter hormaechei]AVE73372.1 DUF3158 domain-containing protein [Enterobacter cloacae complex sp.]MCF0007252.1 DUF3158 family protein [Enterobacter hormaechei]MDE4077289.1 DUF3158 family protein [Enterobacter hormaechei subsp. xiangfangensis]MDU3762828.1 DUF3158 family protein [Enterobacter hormaechei]MDU4357054.1 DUF3158 family protein [Enterobacter hormaechei]